MLPNLAALDCEVSSPSLDVATGTVLDADGLVVPANWHYAERKWMTLALPVRQKFSARYLADCAKLAARPAKVERKPRTGPAPTRFTTDYAVAWGRKQGWKLIERERYDYRLNRHFDLEGMVDAIFDSGEGRIGIQGAGKSERETHFAKFTQWGGAEKARRRELRVIYMEFVRGDKEPVFMEEWA